MYLHVQHSDILDEVGTLNRYLPMPTVPNRKRRRHLFDAEFSAQPPFSSTATSGQPQPVTKDTSSSTSTTSEEALPYDWDLQNLMLAEMGYVPGDSRESAQNYAISNPNEHENSVSIQPSAEFTTPGAEMFEMWSELVAASSKYVLVWSIIHEG